MNFDPVTTSLEGILRLYVCRNHHCLGVNLILDNTLEKSLRNKTGTKGSRRKDNLRSNALDSLNL